MAKKTKHTNSGYIAILVIVATVAILWNLPGRLGIAAKHSQSHEQTKELPDTANYEIPSMRGRNVPHQLLKRLAYTTSYNRQTKTPNWVGWVLTADHVNGEYNRSKYNKFIEDEDVPEPRATYRDIRESVCGYQRGHMCPAGDNNWSFKALKESFLMTNICPQDGDLNQNDWKYLEETCRDWAVKYGKIYIVAGPLFRSKYCTSVGDNHITVPDAFFKVVMTTDKDNAKAIGFIFGNKPGHHDMSYYARSVDNVEAETGFDFFYQLNDSIENEIESKLELEKW